MINLNPFKPGSPVPPGTFAGRARELTQVQKAIFQTSYQSPQNVLITGERGIGKTSIAHIVKASAESQVPLLIDGALKNPLITAYVCVQKGTPSIFVIGQILAELQHQLEPYEKFSSAALEGIKTFFKNFKGLEVAGLGGIQLDKQKNSTDQLEHELYNEAKKVIRKCAQGCWNQIDLEKRSICLIVDELDQMADFNNFSSFWKTLQETIAADGFNNLMLVFVGMPTLNESLAEDHESFLRTFIPLTLDKMTITDASDVVNKVLKNGTKTISKDALNLILEYSERYPHLIQEIGYSAYEVCENIEINSHDVETGIHGNDEYAGSVKRLGELFFSKMYNEIKKSDNFKELLKITAKICGNQNNWASRQQILNDFTLKKTSLDSSIKTLKEKGLLIKNPDKDGEYRLSSKMFQAYVSKILT